MASTKVKKERYLDSLISGDFSKKERVSINNKIDEFSLLEKQLDTDLYRQKFHKDELLDQILRLDPFKQAILTFKLNHESMNEKELQIWFKENVEKIILDKESVKVLFKKLPIRLE